MEIIEKTTKRYIHKYKRNQKDCSFAVYENDSGYFGIFNTDSIGHLHVDNIQEFGALVDFLNNVHYDLKNR